MVLRVRLEYLTRKERGEISIDYMRCMQSIYPMASMTPFHDSHLVAYGIGLMMPLVIFLSYLALAPFAYRFRIWENGLNVIHVNTGPGS